MQRFVMGYITTPNQKEAKKLGGLILKERLAGCVNIVPEIKSMYWWNGKIENQNEVVLIVKTRQLLAKKLIDFVKKHHEYNVPCINILPIIDGNPDYFRWLDKETKHKKNKIR